jgi:hypothetical protein
VGHLATQAVADRVRIPALSPATVRIVIEGGQMKRKNRKIPDVRIVDQVRQASRNGNRLATVIGFVGGGWVPIATYLLAHREVGWGSWGPALKWVLVAGGLLFSAKTIYQWGASAFADRAKALGFVLLLEGVMVCSNDRALGLSALALLIGINGIATGVSLAVKQRLA